MTNRPTDDEPALLTRAIGGDSDALAELLGRYAPLLRNALLRGIPRRFQALVTVDDILQETFTDAFLHIARFVPVGPGAFGAWLTTTARRNLADALRSLRTRRRGGPQSTVALDPEASRALLFQNLVAPDTSPSSAAAKREAAISLNDALQRLPEVYRTVIELHDLQGATMEDVARKIGRTPGAAYLLRLRGLERLRQLLAQRISSTTA